MPKRKLFLSLFPLFLVCGIVTSSSSAQNGKSSLSLATASGWTAKHAPSSDITVAGTIQQVSSEHTPGSLPGLHLLMTSPQGTLDSSIGPFLAESVKATLSSGQQIQVVGFMESINGHSYLVARQLIAGGHQIPIRNEHGSLVHAQSPPGNRSLHTRSTLDGGIQ